MNSVGNSYLISEMDIRNVEKSIEGITFLTRECFFSLPDFVKNKIEDIKKIESERLYQLPEIVKDINNEIINKYVGFAKILNSNLKKFEFFLNNEKYEEANLELGKLFGTCKGISIMINRIKSVLSKSEEHEALKREYVCKVLLKINRKLKLLLLPLD